MSSSKSTSVQFPSVAQSCMTLGNPMDCSTPGLPVHHQLLEFTETHVHRVSDAIQHLILCCPLLLLTSIFLSIRVFCIRWLKYWSCCFRISPSNEYSRLISFRIDLFDPRHSSLLQHHSSKASILRHSAFFIVHLSHPYMATGKTIALTRRTLLAK